MEIDGVRLPFVPINGLEKTNKVGFGQISKTRNSFLELIEEAVCNLKFSSHAKARITSREIDLTVSELEKLQKAVDSVREKGGRESLVIFPDKSFLVSVANRTVITAFANDKLQERVITNIDSVVLGL
ncbi:MAG: TIGR02530 family flagellar biosynthesis protein [Candidatus Kapaibacteriota bacterium]